MTTEEILKIAIEAHKPIAYEYNKPGKTPGRRVGDPYVLFVFTAKDGQKSIKLHIVQTSGVSDSDDRQPLPSFRTHELNWLSNIVIQDDLPAFEPNHPDYNPSWEKYDNVIARV